MEGHPKLPAKPAADAMIAVAEVNENTTLTPHVNTQYQTFNSEAQDVEQIRDPHADDTSSTKPKSFMRMISILLIGVFVSQADTSLVLATYSKISSEFHDLESGSWLLSSSLLAMCVAQPLFGKFSDIYGRKRCLQTAYILFAIGTAGCGVGQTMGQLFAARAIQGAGGAGMVCMVSILLTDLVPLHEVAVYRSYVNIVQTIGRGCGGAVGGYLAQTIGWRWAFLIQCPPTIMAIILVELKIQTPRGDLEDGKSTSHRDKLKRIDFLGALFMSLTILAALIVLDTAGQKFPFTHPIIIASISVAIIGGLAFCAVEKYWAKEPIFPLQLLTHYTVVTSYSILALQNFAQTSIMFIVPVYFQVMMNASTGVAGAYLVPAIAGNMVGGLVAGTWIKQTGRYKLPTILASVCSGIAFTLLLTLWRGHTTFAGSLAIFPGGFATGVAHSAVFIGLTSGVAEEEIAIAGSGLYLSGSVGAVAGVSGASAVFQIALKGALREALRGTHDMENILDKALSDLNYVQGVQGKLRHLMIPAYLSAIRYVFVLGLVSTGISFVVALISREKRLSCK